MIEVTIDKVCESMFLAAMILLAFSLPKLIAGLIWLRWNIFVYRNLKKFFEKEPTATVFNKLIKAKEIKKMADNEELILSTQIKVSEYLEFAKLPFIEALTALVILLFLFPHVNYDDFSYKMLISFIIILIVIVTYSLYMMVKIAYKRLDIFSMGKEIGKNSKSR